MKGITATADRIEYWKKHTYDAWWIPFPSNKNPTSVNSTNEAWSHETVKSCTSCKKVYEQIKYHKRYIVTYYSQLMKNCFKKGKCAYCDELKIVAHTETI